MPRELADCTHFDLLGRVRRVVRYRPSHCRNSVFEAFMREENMVLPETHAFFNCNLAAMYKSIAKYSRDKPVYNNVFLNIAQNYCARHFVPWMSGSAKLSYDAVIKELNLSASCGYAWSLSYPNKKALVQQPWVKPKVLSSYDSLSTDSPDISIWTVAEKPEIRTIEKIEKNKVRTFTAAPFELLVCSNMLMLDMNKNFYKGAGKSWSMVGSTKYMRGWDDLYHRLNKHPNAFELDETDFDASCSAEMLYRVCDLRTEWGRYDESDSKKIKNIYHQFVQSVMVLEDGYLIQKFSGNPSGSPNTVVDNTLILYMLFAYAWVELSQKNDPLMTNYESFHNNVEAALYGDDNTFTCSDLVVGWFNGKSVVEVWSRIGVISTSRFENAVPVKDVDFLSQGFRYDQSLSTWLPSPHLDKLIASIRYGTEVDDPRWHYLRATNLRLDSWGSLECRELITKYITYIMKHHREEFFGECNKLSMNEILSGYKTDNELTILFAGLESSRDERLRLIVRDLPRL